MARPDWEHVRGLAHRQIKAGNQRACVAYATSLRAALQNCQPGPMRQAAEVLCNDTIHGRDSMCGAATRDALAAGVPGALIDALIAIHLT